MKNYIGTKNVKAKLTTRKEYCDYRGWDVPEGEDPDEVIYLVEYEADPLSKPNHPDHKGYITMSPKHVFDKAYRVSDTFYDRLLIESENIGSKIDKLRDALDGGNVPESEEDVLEMQIKAMIDYKNILEERIQRLK